MPSAPNWSKEAVRIVHDEVVDIPIWDSISMYAMNPRFSFTPIQHGNALLRLADISAK